MAISLFHTPEGVRDIYGDECMRKEEIASRIYRVFHSFGYRSIQTPSYEFFDIFNKERGSVPSNQMFKFFDRDGNTLVLRPDITPSIARCAAKYFADETMPVRLCYEGNTFINNISFRGSLKETTVLGAEMISDATSDADAEMLAMLIKSLLVCGLKDFQVEIGEVRFFESLAEEASFEGDDLTLLMSLVEQKNDFGIAALLDKNGVPEHQKAALQALPTLFGGLEVLDRAESLTDNARAREAVSHLRKLCGILETYGLLDYVSFDLGMPAKFSYYTGSIFRAYTYGTGQPIASGGRYDRLLSQFGKDAPATGFLIALDALMTALSRQNIPVSDGQELLLLLYDRSRREEAIQMAEEQRRAGKNVVLMRRTAEKQPDDYLGYAKRSGAVKLVFLAGDGAAPAFFTI